ncbi:MAG: hypothetical protein B1H04_05875 [Planctomycetales bacterium 4484_123]|nr:MAG: hypothetical protein B1H04_05875 [Planctomycetales bacterium 4484_123]
MDEAEASLMCAVQDSHWWWRARRRVVAAVLERHLRRRGGLAVADVGCGFGVHVPLLLAYGQVTCIDPNPEALDHLAGKWGGKVALVRAAVPEPLARRFDLMVLADVLEHIEGDAAAVEWMHRHLNDGGHVLLTVPAHPALWTQMDEAVGHRRRYRRGQLCRLLRHRFEIVHMSYYNMLLLPAKLAFVAFDRLCRLLRPTAPKRSFNEVPPRPVNWLLGALASLEAPLAGRWSLPVGVGLVVLARRRPVAGGWI